MTEDHLKYYKNLKNDGWVTGQTLNYFIELLMWNLLLNLHAPKRNFTIKNL